VVCDGGLRRAQIFRFDGTLVDTVLMIPFNLAGVASHGDVVWIGGIDPADPNSVVRWARHMEPERFVRAPGIYQKYPLMVLLGGAVPALIGDSLAVAFGASEYVFFANAKTGAIGDSAPLPRRSRRGVPATTLQAASVGNGFEVLKTASALTGLAVTASKGLAILHQDLEPTRTGFNGKLFLTTLNSRLQPMCIDIEIPTLGEEAPSFAFVGDTLLLLDQTSGLDNEVKTFVRRLIVSSDFDCAQN
jgi:hypothetical protein